MPKSRIALPLSLLIFACLLGLTCSCSRPPDWLAAQSGNPLHARLEGKHCEIWEDRQGIPHVRAADDLSVYACWGYLHGRDRAFQIEFFRRAYQGRLSEILGVATLKNDFMLRLLGIAELAGRIFTELTPQAREILQAYSFGVNRGLQEALRQGVYEFRKLGFEPQPWRPQDSIGILLLQAFSETQNSFWRESKEANWQAKLGPEAAKLFTQDGLPWDTAILKPGEFVPAQNQPPKVQKDSSPLPESPEKLLPPPRGETGSNSWVLAPAWTRSHHAWFANDPHLDLTYPSFWHLAHLQGATLDMIGAAVPGVPLVASGLNRHLAWGLTDSYMTVGDLVAIPEQEAAGLERKRPVIWFKFGFLQLPFFLKTYLQSKDGLPVLPPVSGKTPPEGKLLLLRWSGFHMTGSDLSHFHELARTQTVQQADRLFAALPLPSFNFVFSDLRGGIGYRVVGHIPRHEGPLAWGYPRRTLEESRSWPMLNEQETPHLLNPKRGYIVTANNRQWPVESRLQSGRSHPEGLRAHRIEALLTARQGHDQQTLAAIQCDTRANDATFLLPSLLPLLEKGPWGEREKEALGLLSRWDYSTGPECRACAIYERWVDRIKEDALLDVGAVYWVLKDPALLAKYRDSLLKGFQNAVGDIRKAYPKEFPQWQEAHRAYFPHLSHSTAFADKQWIFTPGSNQSVSPGIWDWTKGNFSHKHGASLRLLVEMSDPPTAYLNFPGTARDTEEKVLGKDGSPWLKWRDCRFERVAFPLDWTGLKTEAVVL